MKLVSAELSNYCQFRYAKVTFAPGLTAILGRNGSGKSNLVKAVYAAVTGDFGRNDGVKTDNICQFADQSASSKINVTLEHGDSTFVITRSLRPVATRLKVSAPGAQDLNVTKAQEATEAIANILGVSARMLADYVFVDQWSIFDFLSMMPAERAKAFQRLFRTERAEALWKQLGEHIDHTEIPTPGINRDAVIKRLTESTEQYEALSKGLARATSAHDTYDHTRLRQTIADHQRRQAVEKDVQALEQRCETIGKEVAGLSDEVQRRTPADIRLTDFVERERDAYLRARQLLGSWTSFESIERNRQQLLKRITELDVEEAKALVLPIKPEPYIASRATDAAWHDKYDELSHEAHRLRHSLVAAAKGLTECDACGSILHVTPETVAQNQVRLDFVTKELTLCDIYLNASRMWDRRRVDFFEKLKECKKRRTELTEQLSNIPDLPKPEESKISLEAIVDQYEAAVKMQRTTHDDLANIKRQHQGKLSVYEQLVEDFTNRMAELTKSFISDADAAEAKAKLAEYERWRTEVSSLTIQKQLLERHMQDDRAALAQLETVEIEAGATREWITYCTEMRHLLHRDNLPRLVAHNYLELMQDEINNLLVRFGSSFSVSADESLSFVATFHDGRKLPAGRLSGGEKVLLALAFRVAVNDIFAKDLGLLILDEPTAGLDEGNLTCLRIAIQRLRELSASRGLQVIMITHERDLHNLFDHVIDMGKLNETSV